ncbi:MAG: hypothetical protein GXO76_09980 [Calditrichaeota bacterium]|nr:hypothetical protein [Calditrichota bacterium]
MGKKKVIKKKELQASENDYDQEKDPKVRKKKIVYRSYTLGRRMGLR